MVPLPPGGQGWAGAEEATRIGTMTPWAGPDDDGTLLEVWVVAGASRTAVAGEHAGALRVQVAAPAERGRANRALLALLGGGLGVTVELVAGQTARRKRIRAIGISPTEAVRRLRPMMHHDC